MWRVILIDSGENWSRDRYGKGCHSLWLDTTDSLCGYVFSTRFQDGVLTLQDILKALLVPHTGSMSTINWDYANVRILFPLGG